MLANLLYDAKMGKKGSLDFAGLQVIFEEYRSAREERVQFVSMVSSGTTRMQSYENQLWKAGAALLPILGEDFEVNSSSNIMVRGEPLKFIEYQGKEGNIPWNGWIADETVTSPKALSASRTLLYLQYLTTSAIAIWLVKCLNVVEADSPRSIKISPTSDIFNYFGTNGSHKIAIMPMISSYLTSRAPTDLWGSLAVCMNLLPIGTILAVECFRFTNAKSLSTL
jgi:hypothetical protein